MDSTELKPILEQHQLWLDSGGKQGKRANLSNADLSNANLSNANLSNANLSNANLFRASLYNANLSNANLSYADLFYTNLFYANLSNANLSNANLSYADLSYADLYNIKLNLSSHDLISEILKREAKDSVPKRMIAGLILVSRDLCWKDFMAIDHPEKQWALDTIKKYLKEDQKLPIEEK